VVMVEVVVMAVRVGKGHRRRPGDEKKNNNNNENLENGRGSR